MNFLKTFRRIPDTSVTLCKDIQPVDLFAPPSKEELQQRKEEKREVERQ